MAFNVGLGLRRFAPFSLPPQAIIDQSKSTVPYESELSTVRCHMARRTFIGNIYKLVQDPNLISALTGHVEGSRAFSRYRTIDMDKKMDLVKILEGKR